MKTTHTGTIAVEFQPYLLGQFIQLLNNSNIQADNGDHLTFTIYQSEFMENAYIEVTGTTRARVTS